MAYQNTRPMKEKIVILFKGYSSSDLVIHFHKTGGLTRDRLEKESMQQKDVLTFSVIGQVPETLDSTFLTVAIHPVDALGWINSDVTLGQQMFWVSQLQTLSPRRPSLADQSRAWISQCFLCAICDRLAGPLVCQCHQPMFGKGFGEWPACKAPTKHLDSFTRGFPALPPVLLCEICSGAWRINTHALHPCTPSTVSSNMLLPAWSP